MNVSGTGAVPIRLQYGKLLSSANLQYKRIISELRDNNQEISTVLENQLQKIQEKFTSSNKDDTEESKKAKKEMIRLTKDFHTNQEELKNFMLTLAEAMAEEMEGHKELIKTMAQEKKELIAKFNQDKQELKELVTRTDNYLHEMKSQMDYIFNLLNTNPALQKAGQSNHDKQTQTENLPKGSSNTKTQDLHQANNNKLSSSQISNTEDELPDKLDNSIVIVSDYLNANLNPNSQVDQPTASSQRNHSR